MSLRYLLGPVSAAYADQNLQSQRQAGTCFAFNHLPGADLAIGHADSWDDILGRLPPDWRPDVLVLNLSYNAIAPVLWSAPIPIVGLAGDWPLLWHGYRTWLAACDLILTDTLGVETMERAGLEHAIFANLFGCERDFLDQPEQKEECDIDVLFVGNLHPAVQRERLAWLGRLAGLGDHRRIVIETGVFGPAYRQLLRRARIVFNRSIRSECNRRTFEAAASGSLLFQEAENREVPLYLHNRQECVYYNSENLETLLEYYLDHEDERQSIANAGRERVRDYAAEKLWDAHFQLIERELALLQQRAQSRAMRLPADFQARVWQAASSENGDPTLISDLAQALVSVPRSAGLHNALGVATLLTSAGIPENKVEKYQQAAGCFQRALAHDPGHVVAGLNLVEIMCTLGQSQPALDQAALALAHLNRADSIKADIWDACRFPLGFDAFRVEWERAGWSHAGSPGQAVAAKKDLLRWRLQTILAELSGSVGHYYEATVARPDLPASRAALGCALARSSQVAEARGHLRFALDANPFDADAARALFGVLGELGDGLGQRKLADERRLLARAAPQAIREEAWTARVPPPGDELVSIIILCCNQVAYTRLCLESVLKHTRSPYELLLVDNGSTDETPAYLQELQSRPGPQRTIIIRNETNRGFAAGCNQALARARGRYLVFLNNDTVVTSFWLEGLVGWSLIDWPRVGLVGAVSNYAPEPQYVPAAYPDLSGLEPFAAQRRQQFAGKALRVERLTGFCLLARREVLEKAGTFDERFESGFFEDDDLCVRVREAGFQLLIAQNVFIHHFGSRTFAELGIDARSQLEQNFELFREKWGDERAAGYHLPPAGAPNQIASETDVDDQTESASASTRVTPRPQVSLCLIVKNEEHNLSDCLASARDLVDEIIVVDTGSTDATKEIALQHGAKVFEFPWVDSFAAARNESLRHAKGDWIFWLDADDRVDEANRVKLRELFARLPDQVAGYAMKCRCLPDPQSGTATVVDHVRLFRNHPQVRWQYRVHEQIVPTVRKLGGAIYATDIVIQHVGYQDAALRGRKQLRDLRLLELDNAEHPDEPFTLFNLGWAYEELNRPADALPLLRRSLEMSQPSDSIVRKLFPLIMECHRKLGQANEALAVCQEGRRLYPDDAQMLFQEALLRYQTNDLPGAEHLLLHLVDSREGPHFASQAEGLRGFQARHQLAVIYQEQRRFVEAEAQWRVAVAEAPDFIGAWLGLGELYYKMGKSSELENVIRQLEAIGGNSRRHQVGLAALRARSYLSQKEFAAARAVLDEATDQFPEEVWLWVVLSHVLLQEGHDWQRAEASLRRVLELDAANAEARNNLAVLLQQQQGSPETGELGRSQPV